MISTVILKNEFLEFGLSPQFGGMVTFFKAHGRDVFRPLAPDVDQSPLNSGSFPLIPFSNRIHHGAFEYEGKQIQLDINWDADEHAIHGNGWQSVWQIKSQTSSSCELVFDSGTEWWPWPYHAKMSFSLEGRVLTMSLDVENAGGQTMPLGCGFHPYFLGTENTKLHFFAKEVYFPFMQSEAIALPTAAQERLDFSQSKPIKQLELIDHNYDNWDGVAHIEKCNDTIDLLIRADQNMRRAMVYSPPNEGYFCFEPTTHSAGAFNSENFDKLGGVNLPAGEHFSTSFSIEILN
ncbi:aldose 1-epimerase [Hirschia baltica]|uniref:Aldose 1-epimerase n=1 Tax=Hirschia baltica (strain ATCC 49814 / DSM 5838 / IFAM 1418) TaxID=582402 RepID=C6XK96_HIRBI|nr:aldose 1-epimerase [Hirschia baltica]ACT59541.1 Aldose 1-epimerase [Hirschia baltica ATCC 49814]